MVQAPGTTRMQSAALCRNHQPALLWACPATSQHKPSLRAVLLAAHLLASALAPLSFIHMTLGRRQHTCPVGDPASWSLLL